MGTDRNIKILENIYEYSKSKVEMLFHTEVTDVETLDGGFTVITNKGERYSCKHLVLAAGRSGSKWLSETCEKLGLHLTRNRVDIGVRVELPAVIFKHITDQVYESKLVYKTDKYNDLVRTFCMNPYGK